MDPVTVPESQLPYKVLIVRTDRTGKPLATDMLPLRKEIAAGRLVYGTGFGTSRMALELNIPYIPVLEYDLTTQISVTTSMVRSRTRRAIRVARCAWRHVRHTIPEIRSAHSVHCNGYPIFDVARRYNRNCLLYLDLRMSGEHGILRVPFL